MPRVKQPQVKAIKQLANVKQPRAKAVKGAKQLANVKQPSSSTAAQLALARGRNALHNRRIPVHSTTFPRI